MHWQCWCQKRPPLPAIQKGAAPRTLLKLTTKQKWQEWRRTGACPCIPSHPDQTHKHAGCDGCGHSLGTGAVAAKNRTFMPFICCTHAHSADYEEKMGDWSGAGNLKPVQQEFLHAPSHRRPTRSGGSGTHDEASADAATDTEATKRSGLVLQCVRCFIMVKSG